ncbi:MAG: hypothetical protein IK121_06935 [Lachnospiraceae bacterium]|nr:hypothetical protein [Lachnospiraceae bacterium]
MKATNIIQQLLEQVEAMGEKWSTNAFHAVARHCGTREFTMALMKVTGENSISRWLKSGEQIVHACKYTLKWYQEKTTWEAEIDKFLADKSLADHRQSLVLTYKGCGEKLSTWHSPKPCDGMIVWYHIEKRYDYYGTLHIRVEFDSAYPINKVTKLSFPQKGQVAKN